MSPLKNRIGERVGRLTIVERDISRGVPVYWVCRCDCGTTKSIRGSEIKADHTRSCGCLSREVSSVMGKTNGTRHGKRHSSTYTVWRGILARCLNPRTPHFANYGGRGISVCKEWLDFNNFYRDMGDRPAGKSIDRIDNNGNYEPGNCRWATASEQRRNQRPRKGASL